MAREFRLPDIGEGLTEAEIVRWLVAEGDEVAADQPVVEVETDKAVVEIPSPYAGTVISHGGAEGEVIEVGAVLVVIGEAGVAYEAEIPDPVAPPPADSADSEPIVGTLTSEVETLDAPAEEVVALSGAIKALPLVRKLARDKGVDLSVISGSGPGGRILREDVEAAMRPVESAPPPAQAPITSPAEPLPVRSTSTQPGRQKMSRLRRTIAANMTQSWSEIPHVTTFDDVDATRFLEVREALGDRHGAKIPIEALVIKAVLPALDAFPEFNATIDGDDLILHAERDVGIAVDTPDGLLVAVIRGSSAMSVLDIAKEVRRLGEAAKTRALSPDELTGQTFTVSNIGAVGGGHGTPIVPTGTTAILSVGMARMKPVVYENDLGIAPLMPLSLSYDHRVVDGAQGRRFIAMVMENLEEPALFLA